MWNYLMNTSLKPILTEFAGDYLPGANNFICEIHSWNDFWGNASVPPNILNEKKPEIKEPAA